MFTPFIWNLYKESQQGRETIARYSQVDAEVVEELFGLEELTYSVTQEEIADISKKGFEISADGRIEFNIAKMFHHFFKEGDCATIEVATETFEAVAQERVGLGTWKRNGEFEFLYSFGDGKNEAEWYHFIENISFGLYCALPEFYLPYCFRTKFNLFSKICKVFNIPLPEPPTKNKKKQRKKYYAQINHALYDFRKRHNLSPPEMCAFLYDFAEKAIKKDTEDELPKPLKAWFLLGGKHDFEPLDNAHTDTTTHWSGNVDARPGDICVMYCTSPRSYIHSIWRAASDREQVGRLCPWKNTTLF